MTCHRLCPKTTENAQSRMKGPPQLPYNSEADFVKALDAWCIKWSVVHSASNETPEAAVLRLSEKLCHNKDVLQASRTSLP